MAQSQATCVKDQQDVQAESVSRNAEGVRTDFYDLIGMLALERKQQRAQALANTEV